MKRSQEQISERNITKKKLSEPLTLKEIKRLMKYMDVNNNSLNPFLRNSVIIHDPIKINPNPEYKKPIVSKNSLSVQKHNKSLNDNDINIDFPDNNCVKLNSNEEAIKSGKSDSNIGSPILWLKNRLKLDKLVIAHNPQINNSKENSVLEKNSPIQKNSNTSTPDYKQKKNNSSSAINVFQFLNSPNLKRVEIIKENFIENTQTNEFKTLIKGKNFSQEDKIQSFKKLNDIGVKDDTIEENIASLDLSYNRSMKKDQIKEKLNITFSETPSKKNTSQSCSESNTLVKNHPFLNKEIGNKIRFKAGEVIAEGSSSVVYKALNLENGSIFVVKRYNSISDFKLLSTFQNEVKIFQNLDHPNIIKYYDSEAIDSDLFVYLEYLPGGSIKSLLDKFGTLDEKLIKIYLKQILFGISYLHEKGIVHRDLKCANILVDLKGNIKLSDFGCSGQLSNSNYADSEILNSLKGTIPFMAPEVICQNKYGRKADIWSIGCTALEMATGKLPWGHFDNYFQAMYKIGKSNDIPEVPMKISSSFKSFLLNCFKRNYKERPGIKELLSHEFIN